MNLVVEDRWLITYTSGRKVPNKGLVIGHYYHITLKNLVGMQFYEKSFYSPWGCYEMSVVVLFSNKKLWLILYGKAFRVQPVCIL